MHSYPPCPLFYHTTGSSASGTVSKSQVWLNTFQSLFPHLNVQDWQTISNPEDAVYGIVWQPNEAFFTRFPQLTDLFNLGAGVDGIIHNAHIPPRLNIYRLEDAGMAEQMSHYCLYHVLHFHRQMDIYQQQQKAVVWQAQPAIASSDYRVGILGLGVLGQSVAKCLAQFNYQVSGWSLSPKHLDHVNCYHGQDQLKEFISQQDMLCCLLPLTATTRNLLNYENLSCLPTGSVLLNASRGEVTAEKDILYLLQQQHLRAVVLDVFNQEPLPDDHVFWHTPNVIITPHCSAESLITPSAKQIGHKIEALAANETISGLVNRTLGY